MAVPPHPAPAATSEALQQPPSAPQPEAHALEPSTVSTKLRRAGWAGNGVPPGHSSCSPARLSNLPESQGLRNLGVQRAEWEAGEVSATWLPVLLIPRQQDQREIRPKEATSRLRSQALLWAQAPSPALVGGYGY